MNVYTCIIRVYKNSNLKLTRVCMDSPADGTAWEGSGGRMNTAHLQESESHYCVMQY